MINLVKPIKNKYCQDKDLVIPAQCPCCNKCWIFVEPPNKRGRCVFGGPFDGYIKREKENTVEK